MSSHKATLVTAGATKKKHNILYPPKSNRASASKSYVHSHATAKASFKPKKKFGHRNGRSSCAHSIGKFFLCFLVLFSFETWEDLFSSWDSSTFLGARLNILRKNFLGRIVLLGSGWASGWKPKEVYYAMLGPVRFGVRKGCT